MGGDAAYRDPELRRAERRRVLLLNLLPGRFQDHARQGGLRLAFVAALQLVLVVVVGLIALRLVTGEWLPRYAGVVVMGLAVVSQAVCRSLNSRAAQP